MSAKSTDPSFSEMRVLLMEGMRDLRAKKLSAQDAIALSRLGQTIVSTVETELRLRKAIGQKPNTEMIGPEAVEHESLPPPVANGKTHTPARRR